jgi:hypothetical protein
MTKTEQKKSKNQVLAKVKRDGEHQRRRSSIPAAYVAPMHTGAAKTRVKRTEFLERGIESDTEPALMLPKTITRNNASLFQGAQPKRSHRLRRVSTIILTHPPAGPQDVNGRPLPSTHPRAKQWKKIQEAYDRCFLRTDDGRVVARPGVELFEEILVPILTHVVNPALSFLDDSISTLAADGTMAVTSWLANTARAFEQWLVPPKMDHPMAKKYHKTQLPMEDWEALPLDYRVFYTPAVGTTTPGQVILRYDQDVVDPAPTDIAEAMNTTHADIFPAYSTQESRNDGLCAVARPVWRWCRDAASNMGQFVDRRYEDMGTFRAYFSMSTDALQQLVETGSLTLGNFQVEYDVRFQGMHDPLPELAGTVVPVDQGSSAFSVTPLAGVSSGTYALEFTVQSGLGGPVFQRGPGNGLSLGFGGILLEEGVPSLAIDIPAGMYDLSMSLGLSATVSTIVGAAELDCQYDIGFTPNGGALEIITMDRGRATFGVQSGSPAGAHEAFVSLSCARRRVCLPAGTLTCLLTVTTSGVSGTNIFSAGASPGINIFTITSVGNAFMV